MEPQSELAESLSAAQLRREISARNHARAIEISWGAISERAFRGDGRAARKLSAGVVGSHHQQSCMVETPDKRLQRQPICAASARP